MNAADCVCSQCSYYISSNVSFKYSLNSEIFCVETNQLVACPNCESNTALLELCSIGNIRILGIELDLA